MKINKIIYLLIASLLVFTSCNPIVDELHLENSTTVENVELVAVQATSGGNEITLEMKTPGVTGYWNFSIGKALTNKTTIVFPVTGTFDFKFIGTLGAEFFEKPISVTIENLDTPVAPEWGALLGDDPVSGKTWVYTTTPGNGLFWYMAPPDDSSAWGSVWWNAGDCCTPDANGKMVFDLNGGANYTYFADASGEGQVSSFAFDPINLTLTFPEAPLLGGGNERGSPNGTYEIISLTDDEMILYIPRTIAGDSGWTYIYKPAE